MFYTLIILKQNFLKNYVSSDEKTLKGLACL